MNKFFIMIGGQWFSDSMYNRLLSHFKEAFSHTSISIEEAFSELRECDYIIDTTGSSESVAIYSLLPEAEKKKIQFVLHQMIVFKGYLCAAFRGTKEMVMNESEKLYNKYFSYFEKYIYRYIIFNPDGSFNAMETSKNLDAIFINLPKRKRLYETAFNMKKDSLDAFDYAMSLPEITIPDIINIDSLVVRSDPNKVVGFKKTNNGKVSASFIPVDKELIPLEIQRLMMEYKRNFGLDIKSPFEPTISFEEKNKRIDKIFLREAEFHIRFERIHPFNDGNSRTDRIILNYNLVKNHLAPVLITDDMSEDYKKYINNFDIEGLAKMLKYSSSQQLTNWISMCRNSKGTFDNQKLAKLAEFKGNRRF